MIFVEKGEVIAKSDRHGSDAGEKSEFYGKRAKNDMAECKRAPR